MVQTELDRCAGEHVFQQLHYAAPAVDGETGEAPTLCMQVKQSLLNGYHRLALDLLPVDVAATSTIDQQAIASAKECGIEAQGNGRGMCTQSFGGRIMAFKPAA